MEERTRGAGTAKDEQERGEMGNTDYTILFGKSPSKKYPHGVRRLPLPLSCFHYIVLCKHFPPVSPASLLTDGGDDRTQAGRDLPLTFAGRLCFHEHAAAVMTFYPLFSVLGGVVLSFLPLGLFPLPFALASSLSALGRCLSSRYGLGRCPSLVSSRFGLLPSSLSLPFLLVSAVLLVSSF